MQLATLDKISGANAQCIIAIADYTRLVDRHQAVSIAIEAEADIRPSVSHQFLSILREERPTVVINVGAIRISGMQNDFGAERFEKRWGD
jgi:hypothetical protein